MRKIYLASTVLAILGFSCSNNETAKNNDAPETKSADSLKEEAITFKADSLTLNSYVIYKDSSQEKRPAILVIPEWWGLNDYAKSRAKQLANMGYFAMAVDLYGNGQTASTPEEAMKLSGPFYGDPLMGKSRIDAAIARLKTFPQVDSTKIVAIGYCFGGSMVLNSAKLGSDLRGVVSFHGGLQGPAPDKNNMKAQILVCHGADDSFVSPTDSATFRDQLNSIGAVYVFNSYPNAKHAFTNPDADENGRKFNLDIAYNKEADQASWNDMKEFLNRLFH
jgi:dienelactone hydrolase